MRIGAVHRVVAAAFEQSFQIAAAGGPAAGATTEVVVVPVHGHCMDCRTRLREHRPLARLPGLRLARRRRVEGGDEVVLEWLQYADPAAQAVPARPTRGAGPGAHARPGEVH